MRVYLYVYIYVCEFDIFTDLKNDKGKFIICKLSLIGWLEVFEFWRLWGEGILQMYLFLL